ncbi:MAG: hypothetical protein WBB31_01385 [Saprospiraceae bacterium]
MMKRFFLFTILACLALVTVNAQVNNSSYVTQYGEKVLQLSIIIPMDKKEAWKLFSTEEGLKTWIAPVVSITMKTGGHIRTNYDKTKRADDSSSIQLGIINYLEYELLTLKVNLNNGFAANVKENDQNLQEIIQFTDAGNGNTKLVSSMVGWGQGEDWNKAYSFFERGNDWTFKEILKLYEK